MFWHSHWYHTHFKINELLWNIVTILLRIPSWGLNQFAGNVPYFKHLSPSLIILHHSSSCFTFLHHLSSSCIIVHHVSLTKMSLQPMTMFQHVPWLFFPPALGSSGPVTTWRINVLLLGIQLSMTSANRRTVVLEAYNGWMTYTHLMVQRNPKQPPGMVLKPVVNNGDNIFYHINWLAGVLPSTVGSMGMVWVCLPTLIPWKSTIHVAMNPMDLEMVWIKDDQINPLVTYHPLVLYHWNLEWWFDFLVGQRELQWWQGTVIAGWWFLKNISQIWYFFPK